MPTLMTVTKNLFSSSSYIDPEIDPIAQQSVLRFFHDHSSPFTWRKIIQNIFMMILRHTL